jgi:hypothetical protein
MSTFLDALLNRKTVQPAQITPAQVGQPVPVAYITEAPSPLSSDAALNNAAVGAWPEILDNGIKFKGGWVPNKLREVAARNIPGNYGLITSIANFQFRYRAFEGIGSMPGPVPNPYRPMYNNLISIVWHLRVANPNTKSNTTAQKGPITIQYKPATWLGANTASLNKTGEVLL